MGYACPVCDVPQQDGEHLANHLAFTAMTDGGEHEVWLDEHVPGWGSSGPDDLGPRVVEYAEETTYETVFEDTVHDHDHSHDHALDDGTLDRAGGHRAGGGHLDDEARAIVEEAREMTREMLDDGRPDDDDAGADDDADRADDDGDA
jgi:hypothetical protein